MARKDEGGRHGSIGDGFCMIDPVILGGVINDLATMEAAITAEIKGLKTEFEKVGVSTHPITDLTNVSNWLHGELPMLRRRHEAAVLLSSQGLQFTPGTKMLSMPENPDDATKQAGNLAVQRVRDALNEKPPGRDAVTAAIRTIQRIKNTKGPLSPDDLLFLETFYKGLGKDLYKVPDYLKNDDNWIAPTRTTYAPGEIVPTSLDPKTRTELAAVVVGGLLTLSDERRGGGWNRLPKFVQEAASDPYEVLTLEDGGISELGGTKARDLATFLAHSNGDDPAGIVLSKRLAITAAESAKEYIKLGEGSNPSFTDDETARTFLQIASGNEQAMHDLLTGQGMAPPTGISGDIYSGYTGAKDFLIPITTHAWSDDGKAASSAIDWIADASRSTDPQRQALGREAMKGLVTTLTDPSVFNQVMDIERGVMWSKDDSMGQINPEIARALARDTSAFLTELSDPGAKFFTTAAKGMSIGEEVNARLFTLVAGDPKAAEALAAGIYRRNVDGINDALEHPEHFIDQAGRAGQLQGLLDSALHNVALEREADSEESKAEADQLRANALGIVSQFAGEVKWKLPVVPGVDPVDMADKILGRVLSVDVERVDPQQIHTEGVDSSASGASRLLVRYDMTKALIESGRLKPEDLPESIRAGDPPRLKSPGEYSAKAYNTIAGDYERATGQVPGAAQIQDKYLAEYSDRRVNVLISRQAEGKEGLKSKLGLE